LQIEQKNSELENIIAELHETQEQLVTSERMAVLGNMVKGVTHELNTPIGLSITRVSHLQKETERLSGMLSNGEMTKTNLVEYFDESNNLSRSVSVSLRKAAELIQSLKSVSVEQHQDKLSTFNLPDNFEDIVYSVRHSLKEHNIVIRNDIPKELQLQSYPGILYQVYTNLINNSNLHAFEGASEGEILLSTRMLGGQLELTFKDNGKGMTNEVQQRLFEPFFTTKRDKGGTGLGMNIVYTLIIEKLEGKVDVNSELGVGTSYIITLPNLSIEQQMSASNEEVV
jgi:signal transduction histidine kinase